MTAITYTLFEGKSFHLSKLFLSRIARWRQILHLCVYTVYNNNIKSLFSSGQSREAAQSRRWTHFFFFEGGG